MEFQASQMPSGRQEGSNNCQRWSVVPVVAIVIIGRTTCTMSCTSLFGTSMFENCSVQRTAPNWARSLLFIHFIINFYNCPFCIKIQRNLRFLSLSCFAASSSICANNLSLTSFGVTFIFCLKASSTVRTLSLSLYYLQ